MHTVRFDPADGSTPTQATVKTGTLAAPPQENPQRPGFRFDGWTLDGQPFDFQTPILQDTTLAAKWTKPTDWTLSPDHGPTTGARLSISPPDRQEPYYIRLQTAGEQTVGLTGDGRIYTWTQNNTPEQAPFPIQADDGFHYLQAAAGSLSQAALGSDQHIYTRSSGQATPMVLDSGQNSKFTSINMNGGRLIAVDQQGRVHAFQDNQDERRNPTPKLAEQATASLPEQAQAVTAVSYASRILVLDADGQAWTWDTTNTGSVKPERIRQDPGIRIIQAEALSRGVLLRGADGQARYLTDSTTSTTVISLPDGVQASQITTSNDQAIITDKDGHVWAWKPGNMPIRADNREQVYVQATAVDSGITAIDRQGGLFRWSLGAQGNPGKPAQPDAIQAPILEAASMDGQPLKLIRKKDAWQTDVPAHNPGSAIIIITGEQGNQPFTRSLKYTVDQTLTRDVQQDTTYKVVFDTDGGSPKFGDQNVSYPYGRVQRPSPDPTREGYQFDGWFTGNIAYDFSKPVTKGLTITANWTPNAWTITPDEGSQLGGQRATITPPASISRGVKFSQVSSGGYMIGDQAGYSLAVGSDGKAYAWGYNRYGQLGNGTTTQQSTPVPVPKPAGTPMDFTYMQAAAGGHHSLAIGSDGYVYAWGNNDHGQLGNNTKSNSSTPVRVHGPNNFGEGLKAIQVAAGAWSSMALGADGTVYTWGSLSKGYNSDCSSPQTVPTTVKDPSDASGVFHAVQISTSWSFDLAIGLDHYVYAWGYNTAGQLGNNTRDDPFTTNIFHSAPSRVFATGKSTAAAGPWLKAVQVSAGCWYALAIGEDGNTWAWGQNTYGALGNGTSTRDAVANPVPVRVQYPEDAGTVTAVQISAGSWHSLAVDTDGNAWAWGRNDYGQLGNNTSNGRTIPVKVSASSQSTSMAGPWLKAVLLAGGWLDSVVIGMDGYARASGDNEYGQLGNPNVGSRSVAPVLVAFNLQPVITSVTFDTSPGIYLIRSNGNSFTVTTPAHLPGTVIVSVKYRPGGAAGNTLTDTSLRYTYTPPAPVGVLPRTGGAGILLTLVTGVVSMGSVLAYHHRRRKQHRLSQT